MRHANRRRSAARMALMVALGAMSACTAPPAVSPLLRVVVGALRDEAAQVEADAQRDAEHAQQTRQMLAEA